MVPRVLASPTRRMRCRPVALRLAAAFAAAQIVPAAPGGLHAQPSRGGAPARPLPRLRVAPDQRALVTEDGRPFLYLADTGWELFHRLDRAQARQYLATRAAQGFTAVQAVALAELEGLTEPNAHGDVPFVDRDPARPAVTPGSDPASPAAYDYWDHVDFVVDEAARRGLYVAMLPTWARWVNPNPRAPAEAVFDAAKAEAYGRFLGRRYAGRPVIWVLGGDRPGAGVEPVWRAMARGIAVGAAGREDYGAVLMTFHPSGGETSATWFHADPWLDFNMQQTGHSPAADVRGWGRIAADRARTPAKPVVDGEPLYEDHPIGFRGGARANGFSFDAHVRQRAYWHLLAGAAGFTYGNHAVWQMYAPGRQPINGPLMFWDEAVLRPGAAQMRHVRTLMESRPMLARVPDQALVADTLAGPEHVQAARGDDYLFVYSAQGRPFAVHMGRISGARVRAHWYNPRNGTSWEAGTFDNAGTREFTPQYEGLGSDWVLVLDDASKRYPAPGRATPPPAARP